MSHDLTKNLKKDEATGRWTGDVLDIIRLGADDEYVTITLNPSGVWARIPTTQVQKLIEALVAAREASALLKSMK